MTAQIPDYYHYKGRNHQIIAMTNPIDFNPEDYGFRPAAPHTACWRGYICQYDITDDQLFLSKLWVNQEVDDPYPVFDGVSPTLDRNESMMVYKELRHRIDYDGRVVVGSGFLREYYIHMGFQRAWAFRNVYELVFEHGKVIRKINHSKVAEGIRKKIAEDPHFLDAMQSDIVRFVNESFSLDKDVKAWWI